MLGDDGDAFLSAVLAHPDDDATRLVFADWLDDHGDPARAEFVRVQCELATAPPADRRLHLEHRQRDLLVAHEGRWVAPLAAALQVPAGRWGGWVFRRGFVEYFHLRAHAVVVHGDRLAALTPVRELYLWPCRADQVRAIATRRWAAHLTALYLPSTELDDAAAHAVLTSRHLANLRTLVAGSRTLSADGRAKLSSRFAPTAGAV